MSGCVKQLPSWNVAVRLYVDVENAGEVLQSGLEGGFAVLDAGRVGSVEKLYAGVYKCLLERSYGKRRSRDVHSELLLNVAGTTNGSEAARVCGVRDDTKALLVVKMVEKNENTLDVDALVHGKRVEVTDDILAKLDTGSVDLASILLGTRIAGPKTA